MLALTDGNGEIVAIRHMASRRLIYLKKRDTTRISHVVLYLGTDEDGTMLVAESSSFREKVLKQPIDFNGIIRVDTNQEVVLVERPNYNYGLEEDG